MRKWLILTAIVILCLAGAVAGAYVKAMQPKKDAADEAFKTAKSETDLTEMDQFYLYSGKNSYSVAVGKAEDGKRLAVFVPDDKKAKIITENLDGAVSEEEIREKVTASRKPAEIISVKMGVESGNPVWEATFLDSAGRYHYDYYDLKSGEWLKYYRSI